MTHPKGMPQVPVWLLPAGTQRRQVKATRPLKLPRKAPPCFDSQQQWGIYRVLSQISGDNQFNYCTDCLPEHKEQMCKEQRCRFPGTTFVLIDEDTDDERIEGRRAR